MGKGAAKAEPATMLRQWVERDLTTAARSGELRPAFEVGATPDELSELIASGRHPILVGEPGVGRTAVRRTAGEPVVVARVYAEGGCGAFDPRTGARVPRMKDVRAGRLDALIEAWRSRSASERPPDRPARSGRDA
jgi:hypothetical protein